MGFIVFLFFIIFIFAIVAAFQSNKNTRPDIVNSQEFQKSLAKALKIKQFFKKAADKDGGSVIVVKYNHDLEFGEHIDWSGEKYNSCVFFRVRLEYGYNTYLDVLHEKYLDDSISAAMTDAYLVEVFGMNTADILAEGLVSPYDIAFDMKKGDDDCEGILFYKFLCPCGLRGDDRDIFIDAINKESTSMS